MTVRYRRQNLHEHGGRYVAVTEADTPQGPWGELKLIELKGYDWHGGGNLYMWTANPNPVGADTLLALFPLNLGIKGQRQTG